MSEKRTATQILLNIEGDIKYIKSAYQSLDYKLNLILNALNGRPAPPTVLPPGVPHFDTVPPRDTSSQLPVSNIGPPAEFTQVGSVAGTQSIMASPVSRSKPEQDDNGNLELQIDPAPKSQRRTANRPTVAMSTETAQRVQVQQKIMYPDGDKVTLATVNIFDESGGLVKSTRTNSFGNWVAALPSGGYRVQVKKAPLKNKIPVEVEYKVVIPSSDTPVELEPPKL